MSTVFMAVLFKPVHRDDKPRVSGALEALSFWAAQRAYPQRTIPEEGFYRAFYQTKNQKFRPLMSSGPTWKPMGPRNIGGRTLSLAINPSNPNTIWAGSASGGIWRTNSGGLGSGAWHYVHTGYPVLGVGSIAIAPDDTSTLYIGTGEVYGYQDATIGLATRTERGSYGIGILKTTDNGVTWTKSLDWSYAQQRGVWAVRINPLNSSTVWAATTEGTYKSVDAGQTWKPVHNVIMAMDLIIHPQDTGMVFVACGDLGSPGSGIYRTSDGGMSWIRLPAQIPENNQGKTKLAVYSKAPNVIFASVGLGWETASGTRLLKSVDNGDSWNIISTINYARYQGWYSHFVAIHPEDSSQIYCGGVDFFKSMKGGRNLEQRSVQYIQHDGPPVYAHPDFHAIAFHPVNPDTVYFGSDGGVWRSTNGGTYFQPCCDGYQTTQFYNGFSSSPLDSSVMIGGMQDNSTAIYSGTDVWENVLGGDGIWTAIDPANPDILYGSYQYIGTIWKSTDRGLGWRDLIPPNYGVTCFVGPYIVHPANSYHLYVGRSYVLKSTNQGLNWNLTGRGQPLDNNPVLAMAGSAYNENVVYCSTAPIDSRAGVFITRDGGASWENITDGLPDRYPVDLAVDPLDDGIAYVTLSGFGTSHLYKTTDSGGRWTDIGSGLPDIPTSAVVVDPDYPDQIYVGNDIGVFYSDDGGASWTALTEGLPDAVIAMDLSVSRSNRSLRLASHGNGVWQRGLVAGAQTRILPEDVSFWQNAPNPFNASTWIRYYLPERTRVRIVFYDILGREVDRLIDETQSAGMHHVHWQPGNLASGVYIGRLQTDDHTRTIKLTYVK